MDDPAPGQDAAIIDGHRQHSAKKYNCNIKYQISKLQPHIKLLNLKQFTHNFISPALLKKKITRTLSQWASLNCVEVG